MAGGSPAGAAGWELVCWPRGMALLERNEGVVDAAVGAGCLPRILAKMLPDADAGWLRETSCRKEWTRGSARGQDHV